MSNLKQNFLLDVLGRILLHKIMLYNFLTYSSDFKVLIKITKKYCTIYFFGNTIRTRYRSVYFFGKTIQTKIISVNLGAYHTNQNTDQFQIFCTIWLYHCENTCYEITHYVGQLTVCLLTVGPIIIGPLCVLTHWGNT